MTRNAEAPPPRTLDASAVSEMLSLSRGTVLTWAKTDRMPAYQIGRSWIVFSDEIQAWLESTSNRPQTRLEPAADLLAELPPLLTKEDVAQLLHVSEGTVGKLLAEEAMSYLNLGTLVRIPSPALKQFLARARNDAPAAG